nr:uncharacterized protein LOC126055830 [Helicoverpa armigera]
MNLDESAGCSSSKGQENGDASNGSERPLKKARFAWQVKGKYHLKNETSGQPKTSTTESIDPPAVAGSSGSGSSNNIGTEQNLERLGDYLMKQDFNTLDSVMAEPDNSHLNPSATDNFQYPRYVSSRVEALPRHILQTDYNYNDDDEMESVPMSLVPSQCYTEDQCIARWQARQMAKGVVDNTINRVLDTWVHVPVPPEDNSTRTLALDVADFINNLPSDNSVENEGILMAISAHGLQNPDFDEFRESPTDEQFNNIELCLSPFNSDDENPVNRNHTCHLGTSSADLDMPWSYSDDQKDDYAMIPGAASLSYQFLAENLRNQNNMEIEDDNNDESFDYLNENQNNSDEASDDATDDATDAAAEGDNHCDFLDAAVLYAIQSRGLTTFGSEYG